jgi:hypothetical protein
MMEPAPNDREKRAPIRRWIRLALLLLLGLGLSGGFWLWQNLFRRAPLPIFDTPEAQFKYGALGYGTMGELQGFPLYLWQVLPEVFADKLPRPGGWSAFGLVTEPGMEYPVGFASVTVGFPGLVPNCALCHSGTVRQQPGDPPRLILGAPAHQLDFDAFNDFVFACADDPRWTTATLLPRIEKVARLTWSERIFYRVLIPALRDKIRAQKAAFAWQSSRPPAGCGRTDAFNRFKINVLKLPDDGTIGTSDFPPIWNQARREGLWMHWNGSGNRLRDENLLSVLPVIKAPAEFDSNSFEIVHAFLSKLPPPAFPFPIDAAKSARGQTLFKQHCADCHAFGGAKTGDVTPAEQIGTDPAFLKMWSRQFVDRLRDIDSPPFRFPSTRNSNGYINVPLDGVWMRAPYLHNGSVPTLWDLLQPPADRPVRFHRGYDVHDPVKVGFISAGTVAERTGFLFDTQLLGNGNSGHTYGTALSAGEKWDLIEFLKTL